MKNEKIDLVTIDEARFIEACRLYSMWLKLFNAIKSQKKNKKPRINISYDSNKIFKDGIKVIVNGGYSELRHVA